MTDRVVALRVGIVLLAAGFITGFLIILLGEGRGFLQRKYTLHMKFPEAPGVAVDTPVRKNGVLIGRVSHVELRDDEGTVIISARIDGGRKVFKDEVPYIHSSTLLGDSVVEFVRNRNTNQPHQPYQDGDFLGDGQVTADPIRVLTNLEGDVRNTLQSFEAAANNVSNLSTRLQNVLGTNDDQLQRLAQKTESALDQIQKTFQALDGIVGDPEVAANLKDGIRRLPKTFEDLQMMMVATRETMDSFKSMQQRVEKNLDNIEPFTKSLGEHGDDILLNANKIAKNFEDITTIGAELAERLRNADGSFAKFLREDELYNKVNDIADNLLDASRRIRPVIDDVRVFTDKIARDPRQLGVKGALEKRPVGAGIKGLPTFRESTSP